MNERVEQRLSNIISGIHDRETAYTVHFLRERREDRNGIIMLLYCRKRSAVQDTPRDIAIIRSSYAVTKR